jgi:hypothetical protein
MRAVQLICDVASRTFMVASMISSSGRPIQSAAGANTSSSIDLLGSSYSRHVVDMSAYTLSSGDRLNSRWSTAGRAGHELRR